MLLYTELVILTRCVSRCIYITLPNMLGVYYSQWQYNVSDNYTELLCVGVMLVGCVL